MKVIVFGSTGLIGRQLVKKLLNQGHEVTGVSRNPTQNHLNNKSYKHIILDISKKENFSKLKEHCDCVFNTSAYITNGYLSDGALPCLLVNAIGVLNILDFMVEKKISRMIHSSSATVYGKPKNLYVKEEDPLRPIIVYGISKLTAESYCDMYSDLYNFKITQLRYGPVYGPGLKQKTALTLFIEKAIRNEDITLFEDGSRSQDYVYVKDVVDANLLAFKKNIQGIFNIGSGKLITMKQLAETIIEVFSSKSKIKHDYSKTQDFSIGINIEKAHKELGYNPVYDIKAGLEDYKDRL